jgi:predicted nucleic acid-binding protein
VAKALAELNRILVDTSGWASFFVRTEPHFDAAKRVLAGLRTEGGTAITTNYILAELVALLSSRVKVTRPRLIEIVETIRSTTWVQMVHIDADADIAAWKLLRSHADKSWSLVDCSTFALMRAESVSAALTTDHHFEQAGFTRLLR